MSATQDTRLGIILMILTSAIFAIQDAVSRHLGSVADIFMIVCVRYWFFALFVIALSARKKGGLRAVARSKHSVMQILRAALLCVEVCVMVLAFVKLGLIETHAVFICYPLLVTTLSAPILGEKIGWRRWSAVFVGFLGVLVILQPGTGVFSIWALLPFVSALMFALYGLLTRYVARDDSADISFFWTGIWGAIIMTPLGLYYWDNLSLPDWGWMGVLCCTSVSAHYCLIKAYDVAEASAIQPFAYFQLPFVALVGVMVYSESLHTNVIIGSAIVITAGLFTWWRQRIHAGREKTLA